MSSQFSRSCLRWPGNKYSLLNQILQHFPKKFNNYHEPFIGSASVFLNVQNNNISYLSDSNENLINFYIQVRDNPNELINHIKGKENTEVFFYDERKKHYESKIEKAAQLYFLNRTCFNGIYRVNSKGEFNVPYGKRHNLIVIDEKNLFHLSNKLKNANINACDFEESLSFIQENDFIYLDPPYSGTKKNNFLMYNDKLFDWQDQLRLQKFCQTLIERNVNFVLNNLYNIEIFSLFATELGLKSLITERISVVSSQMQSRLKSSEYLFLHMNK